MRAKQEQDKQRAQQQEWEHARMKRLADCLVHFPGQRYCGPLVLSVRFYRDFPGHLCQMCCIEGASKATMHKLNGEIVIAVQESRDARRKAENRSLVAR